MRTLCKTCDKAPKRQKKPHEYVVNLYTVHMLQEAGFPFTGDAFALQFWLDLAVLKGRIKARQSPF